jgi:hypothetical protein
MTQLTGAIGREYDSATWQAERGMPPGCLSVMIASTPDAPALEITGEFRELLIGCHIPSSARAGSTLLPR